VTRLVIETLTNDYQEAARVIRQLQAERDAAEAREWDWRPNIGNAPRDGTWILVKERYTEGSGWPPSFIAVHWADNGHYTRYQEGWMDSNGGFEDLECGGFEREWLPIRALKKERANG
jgi:hypothetical protein